MEVKTIKVRDIKISDIWKVAAILNKASKGAKVQLALALSENPKVDLRAFGFDMILTLLMESENELKAWFADLTGMTKEEFDNLPLTAIKDIYTQLSEKEDLKGFLASAVQSAKKVMPKDSTPTSTLSNTATDGQTIP